MSWGAGWTSLVRKWSFRSSSVTGSPVLFIVRMASLGGSPSGATPCTLLAGGGIIRGTPSYLRSSRTNASFLIFAVGVSQKRDWRLGQLSRTTPPVSLADGILGTRPGRAFHPPGCGRARTLAAQYCPPSNPGCRQGQFARFRVVELTTTISAHHSKRVEG